MSVEEAIRTALAFEEKVRDVYADAARGAGDPTARKVLEVLAREEQGHLDYLESRLRQWTSTGQLTAEALATILPSKERIAQGGERLQARMRLDEPARATALETLKRALQAEVETSTFYQQMVATLPPGAPRDMFGRFLEIEAGHQAMVAAEIDSVTGLGYWFDYQEFELEAG